MDGRHPRTNPPVPREVSPAKTPGLATGSFQHSPLAPTISSPPRRPRTASRWHAICDIAAANAHLQPHLLCESQHLGCELVPRLNPGMGGACGVLTDLRRLKNLFFG
jgi:hypothetical protein